MDQEFRAFFIFLGIARSRIQSVRQNSDGMNKNFRLFRVLLNNFFSRKMATLVCTLWAKPYTTELGWTLLSCAVQHPLNYAAPSELHCTFWATLSWMSECQNVRHEKKCRCRNQSGTGTSIGIGLRWWMPECRWRRHPPRCRCRRNSPRCRCIKLSTVHRASRTF